jgi:hypothetical protein
MKKIIYFNFLVFVFLYACKEPVKYPDIPEIKVIDFVKYQDDKTPDGLKIVFHFQDGNGDIGLNGADIYPPFDTSSVYYYNFFCDYYEKQNGIFEKIKLPSTLNARIPRLSDLPEESIDGEIYLQMPNYYNTTSPYDTIKLEFFIVDRKLNHSNVENVVVIR